MKISSLIQYGVIGVIIAGVYFAGSSDSDSKYDEIAANDIDLNAVLDVTLKTLQHVSDDLAAATPEGEEPVPLEGDAADQAFLKLSDSLTVDYNAATPALHDKPIAVSPQIDASLIAFEDLNQNRQKDAGEDAVFMIEIDGENARIIATSRSGAVNDHHFSGTGLLAGYLIGSMLSRQRASGVDKSRLASKKTVTSQSAARARAGSGSHRAGK